MSLQGGGLQRNLGDSALFQCCAYIRALVKRQQFLEVLTVSSFVIKN